MSIPAKPSLFQYEVQVFNAEPCKWLSGPDGGSVLWFNIADLSDHCSVISLQMLEAGFVNGQVSLAWSIALRTYELYTRPHVLKEKWREERTGFSSLNFFQAAFTRVVVESSQPPAAESMSPREQK